MADFTKITALDLIARELQKRLTTYPKAVEREKKKVKTQAMLDGFSEQDAETLAIGYVRINADTFAQQMLSLKTAQDIIGHDVGNLHEKGEALAELRRELKMRKSLYPRFTYLKRITPEVASCELEGWSALVEYFTENFLAKS